MSLTKEDIEKEFLNMFGHSPTKRTNRNGNEIVKFTLHIVNLISQEASIPVNPVLGELVVNIAANWEEVLKYGRHEGACTNKRSCCPSCGQPKLGCKQHFNHIKMRETNMKNSVEALKAFLDTK